MGQYTWADLVRNPRRGLSNTEFANRQDSLALTTGNQSEHMEMFNRFYMPEGQLYLDGGFRGYLFFTRPDCNLMDIESKWLNTRPGLMGSSAITPLLDGYKQGVAGAQNIVNKYAIMQLQHNTGFPSAFMPIFTNTVRGYTPQDQSIGSVEKGNTNHGAKIKYGTHSIASRSSGTFNLTFEDTKYLPVYKTLSVWTDYIEKVYLGDHSPNPYYIQNGVIDYAVSVFYIVTRNYVDGIATWNRESDIDGANLIKVENPLNAKVPIQNLSNPNALEIVYWEKLVGVFPKTRPDSAFATTPGEYSKPTYNVEFEYSMKSKSSILDPYVLSELNTLSKLHHSLSRRGKSMVGVPNSYTQKVNGRSVGTEMANPFVSVPIVERARGTYYLSWNIFQ